MEAAAAPAISKCGVRCLAAMTLAGSVWTRIGSVDSDRGDVYKKLKATFRTMHGGPLSPLGRRLPRRTGAGSPRFMTPWLARRPSQSSPCCTTQTAGSGCGRSTVSHATKARVSARHAGKFSVYRVLQAVPGWQKAIAHRHARNEDATLVSHKLADGRAVPLCYLPSEHSNDGCVLSGVAPQDRLEGRGDVVAQFHGMFGGNSMRERRKAALEAANCGLCRAMASDRSHPPERHRTARKPQFHHCACATSFAGVGYRLTPCYDKDGRLADRGEPFSGSPQHWIAISADP